MQDITLPEGWEWKKLGDINKIVNGGTPDTKMKEFWDGDILWITPKDLGKLTSNYVDNTERKITNEGLNNSSAKILPINSVILSSRAPIGHLAINQKPISTNQGCKGLIPKDNLDTLFLFYFLKHSVKLLNDLGSGTTFLELSSAKLSEVEIPLPPLPEQKRLVAKLDQAFTRLDEAINLQKQSIGRTKELKKAILQEVFSNEDWEVRKLGDLVNKIQNGFACNQKFEIPDGYTHLRTHNISTSGKLNFDKLVKIQMDKVHKDLSSIKKGDVIFNNTNSVELVGKTVLIDKDYNFAFSNHLTLIRTKDILNPSFLVYYFMKLLSDKYFENICNRWIGQAGINSKSLKEIKIPTPQLSEQTKIVQYLDQSFTKIDSSLELQNQRLAHLESLKKSILTEAFEGKL